MLKLKVVKGQRNSANIIKRDFLYQHKSIEFDWGPGRIRINDEWITHHLWVKGGSQPGIQNLPSFQLS